MSSFSAARLAAWESRFRPLMTRLPAPLAVRLYSSGRRSFLDSLTDQPPAIVPMPRVDRRRLWGLDFRQPLFNAAGMFKAGQGYELVAAQGAGAYLAGTTTDTPRQGNKRQGISQPFAPYPRSGAASNWLGLPNPGHAAVAARLAKLVRVDGCPIGASAAADPGADSVDPLAEGLRHYDAAGVDFLEINESCPNTEADDGDDFVALSDRLHRLADRFLTSRQRRLPVLVKFSTDTDLAQVPALLDLLIDSGFDGVNFGNTSVDYTALRQQIEVAERSLYDFFVGRFGGGVSGRPLAGRSRQLCQAAVRHLEGAALDREFHVVRTGGIESAVDLEQSLADGVALCQWYSGYFEAFADHGHDLYRQLLSP